MRGLVRGLQFGRNQIDGRKVGSKPRGVSCDQPERGCFGMAADEEVRQWRRLRALAGSIPDECLRGQEQPRSRDIEDIQTQAMS